MPLIKITGISVFRGVRFTLSDSLVLLIVIIPFISNIRITFRKYFLQFFFVVLLFFSFMWLSVIKANSLIYYLAASIPWIYALLFLFATGQSLRFLSEKDFLTIRKIFILLIVTSFIIPYYELITGTRILFFFHANTRYAFFLNNPNQYSIFTLVAFSVITLITISYREKSMKLIFALSILQIYPCLLSGSRSGFFLFLLLSIIIAILMVLKGRLLTKVLFLTIVPLVIIIIATTLEQLVSENWTLNRAFSIFELLNSGEAFDMILGHGKYSEGEGTGASIRLGIRLFMENIFFGIGLGNFTLYNESEVHNTFISVLTETGLVGFLGFFILIIYIFYNLFVSKLPILVKFCTLFFLFIFFAMNITHMLLRERWVWFFFAFIIIMSNEYKPKRLCVVL